MDQKQRAGDHPRTLPALCPKINRNKKPSTGWSPRFSRLNSLRKTNPILYSASATVPEGVNKKVGWNRSRHSRWGLLLHPPSQQPATSRARLPPTERVLLLPRPHFRWREEAGRGLVGTPPAEVERARPAQRWNHNSTKGGKGDVLARRN